MPKGAPPGTRYGGRQKGTKNKKTLLIEEILSSLDCDPIKNLASIARGEPQKTLIYLNKETGEYIVDDVPPPINEKTKANIELASYLYPKRKAVEHTGLIGQYTVTKEQRDAAVRAAINADT